MPPELLAIVYFLECFISGKTVFAHELVKFIPYPEQSLGANFVALDMTNLRLSSGNNPENIPVVLPERLYFQGK